MTFTRINYETWERREMHEFFGNTVMYLTAQLDVTALRAYLKQQGLRFYPALLHCIARVANGRIDHRYGRDEDGNLGIWDEIHPFYTVPRLHNPRLFSMVVTRYRPAFADFYADFLTDYARAENCGRLHCDAEMPPNIMGITAVPGLHFTAFAFGIEEEKTDFAPFVVLGRYAEDRGRLLLPVSGEFRHSTHDGYQIAEFFQELQQAIDDLPQA